MQVSWSCDAHRRRTKDPALHVVHEGVDLHPLRQPISSLNGPADTLEERATHARGTAAELHPSRRLTTAGGTVNLSRSATEKGWTGYCTRLAWHDPSSNSSGSAVRGLWEGHNIDSKGSHFPVGSLTWSASWKTHRGAPIGKTTDLGWPYTKKTYRPADDIPSHGNTAEGLSTTRKALRSEVLVDGDSWQYFAGQRFRTWRTPQPKAKTINMQKRRGRGGGRVVVGRLRSGSTRLGRGGRE